MKVFISALLITVMLSSLNGQSAIFLHHSTGEGVYVEGGVAGWISNYNSANGTSYSVTERSYPDTPYPWENYPYDYWNLWINNQCNSTNPNIQCLNNILQSYDVVIYKHCFPGAGIAADNGTPSVSSPIKTIANYKLQYRALRNLMDQYPGKKFIVWTLAPLHRLETTTEEASRAREFVNWVKSSWLTEDGKSHPNIYIFDFFGLVAESNPTPVNGKVNCLKYEYEKSHTIVDSHPNTLANTTVGPIFAQFIVNTFKGQTTEISDPESNLSRLIIYPNPSDGIITLEFSDSSIYDKMISIDILNLNGQIIFSRQLMNQGLLNIDASAFAKGMYLIRVNDGKQVFSSRVAVD